MSRDKPSEVTRTLTVDPEDSYSRELVELDTQIGPYIVEEVAAIGGFGVVYRASSPSGERVAVKVLHPSFATALNALGRFQREIRLVERSRHPNIVEILAFGELPNGSPYLVMEWLDGVTLSEALKEHGPMDLDAALTVMEGLSSALAAVHAAGVVHRDLKGSNIMVLETDDRLRVKLLDFGIAKLLDQSVKLTRTGAPIGTPGYMAPEQIRGQRVGPPTDIYSLGILLFMMLTGEHPREYGTSASTTADEIIASLPTDLSEQLLDSERVSGVPAPVGEVIARCMNLEPYQRYPSIEEMMEELRDAISTASPSKMGAQGKSEQRSESLRTQFKMGAAIHFELDSESSSEADVGKAAEICKAEGFAIACREAFSFLALITLPENETAARAVRQRVVHLALRIVGQSNNASTSCSATIHAAPTVMLLVNAMPQLTGGELLDVDTWLQRTPSDTVEATGAALAGIESSFVIELTTKDAKENSYFRVIDIADYKNPAPQ